MDLPRSDFTSTERILKNQKGFALIFLLSFLPVALAGFLIFAFSQFLTANWMRSAHICRTELLKVQKSAGSSLTELMKLNSQARLLRQWKDKARVELVAALASKNPAWIAKARLELMRIEALQARLGAAQRLLIEKANLEMSGGLANVIRRIRQQSQEVRRRLPSFFQFEIQAVRGQPKRLAVRPDRPDIAPVYELEESFKEKQALSVSWISSFGTISKGEKTWITNQHKKPDSCSASLNPTDRLNFSETLLGGRSFLKF